uniref:Serine/arginine-rich splicing factor 2 n=1 Tax=Acrobeloides nanus TaxID=290746 RepID=A0A914C7C9_9BILA
MSGRKLPPPTIDHLYSVKVDNISYHTSPNDLRRLFDRYGEIGDVHIPRDRRTRQSRGFGFVRFFSRKDAEYAISRVDGKRIDGRELRCSMAKYDRPIDEKHRKLRSCEFFAVLNNGAVMANILSLLLKAVRPKFLGTKVAAV